MEFKKLTKTQRTDVYNKYLVNDFNKSEVKTFNEIEDLIKQGYYLCYGFYENEDLLGYSYFIKSKQTIVMDYLAVNSEYRNKGLGSKFISIIKSEFSKQYLALIAEVENPRYSDNEKDKYNRERRISFYINNGFKLSNIETCVTKDQYSIIKLELNKDIGDKEIFKQISLAYRTIFGEELFKKQISVSTI